MGSWARHHQVDLNAGGLPVSHIPLILSKRQASTDSQQPPSSTSVKSSHMEMQPPFLRQHPPLCSLPIFFTLLPKPV